MDPSGGEKRAFMAESEADVPDGDGQRLATTTVLLRVEAAPRPFRARGAAVRASG
ncbi:hypothetical protein MFU01_08690 [Myxococcus fulvus]|uniref:Uncharacterized protein n=1 Tax=Myxococcus fulvus TaxID=33 RepID=A0A511SWK3_MYXFU|nr:hypothetical protein MFU01_08690 [Myxococcus fulvus]